MEKTAKRDIRIPVPPVPPQHSPAPVQAVPAVPAASIPEEVVRFQEYKAKKRSTPQPLAISKPVTLVEEESEPFDLRKAVIYAAILERPHK
ncbi:hypothetical protein FAZ19_13610 [Sphingobacterium alkalisoli]|uniref:Uncharacterized protein n=1 Tax=Sphingobacterium alkalisoli TaxID=1874115 RepID=A0A4U0GZR1_9SPHI|nr:hypothetical protein [Sphingobacterium alkalisoli]TJY64244.1 hypothetical protein FAZ19_13610 [Sphingobacterium alkalisoli]